MYPLKHADERPRKEQKNLKTSTLMQNVKPIVKSLNALQGEIGSEPCLSAFQDKRLKDYKFYLNGLI